MQYLGANLILSKTLKHLSHFGKDTGNIFKFVKYVRKYYTGKQ